MSFEASVCPSCQKDIQIPTDVVSPHCPYCGRAVKLEAAAPLATISTLMGMARSAEMAGNSEEALEYFNRVLESDPSNSDAWIGKGKAAGWMSTLRNVRVSEALVAFGHAIATAPHEEREATAKRVVDESNRLIVAIYQMARKSLMEYIALPNSWSDYVATISILIDNLDVVLSWCPENRDTMENIVHLCKDNIEGVSYRDKFDQNLPKAWGVTPNYEAILRSKMDTAISRLKELDSSYLEPVLEKKKADACFVVTATMGDADHPEVQHLRAFRDEWLLKRRIGTIVVDYYYKVGPFAASVIGKSLLRRRLSYLFIVKPLSWISRRLLSR